MKDPWIEIIRTTPLSSDEFWLKFGAARHPVIIEDSIPEWKPAVGWTIEYLRSTVGHRTASLDRGYFEQSPDNAIVVGEVLDAIEKEHAIDGHQHPYLRNVDLYKDLPELVPDISPRFAYASPNWMACKLLKRYIPDGLVEFFIGGSDSAFPKLHIDTHGSHAFITQLQGTKHIVAAPPSATPGLTRTFGDPEKFRLGCESQKYEHLELYSATLSAGDTLYVPAGWWHTAYMTELSVSVSTNCVNRTNWSDYIDYVTKQTQGAKKPVKRGLLAAIGILLKISDAVGFGGIYRRYE